MAEEIKYIDADSFNGSGKNDSLTFKDIVLQHLKRIGTFASVEMRGGFWEIRPNPNPGSNEDVRVYIPDTREIYSNSIEYLHDILFPYFDKEMLHASKHAEEELKKAFNDNTVIKQADREDQSPEDTISIDRSFKNINDRITFRSKKVLICRNLFRDLNCFLHRIRYLESDTFEEKV